MIKYCSLHIQVVYYVCFLSYTSLLCLGLIFALFFICLFYLWICSAFSLGKKKNNYHFLSSQVICQFCFFFAASLPETSTSSAPSQSMCYNQDSCSLGLPFEPSFYYFAVLHHPMFLETSVSFLLPHFAGSHLPVAS